jgi:hypothetical protein
MQKKLTPMKAIRLKCLDCCCGQKLEVKFCPSDDCPLHPFRMGHRPEEIPTYETSREVTEEQSERLRNLLKERRNSKGSDATHEKD